jgi:hypothetical protein
MKNLSSLLERLTGALYADSRRKSAVSAAIKECIGGEVRNEDVSIKDGVLTIHASPALKNELRLKEEKVLRCIYEKSGSRIVRIIYA